MNNINIHKATLDNVTNILPLMAQLGYSSSSEELTARFKNFINSDGYGIAIASLDNKIVGLIAWSKSLLFVSDKTRIHIEALIVGEKYRGKQIGKKLMEYLEEIAKKYSPVIVDLTSGYRHEYDWALPQDGLYEADDYKKYFTELDRKAYLVKATLDNVTNILPLMAQLGYSSSSEELTARFKNFINSDGYGIAIASLDNKIVGLIAWSKSLLFVSDKTRIHIEALIVDEKYRGKQIDEYDLALPQDGLYEADDYKKYFTELDRKAYLVKVNKEIADFVLLNKVGTHDKIDWNMGEFFIIARFQNKGVGGQVAKQIWQMHKGPWEVSVIPENKPALLFWRKVINEFTKGNYLEEVKLVQISGYKAERVIFEFNIDIL
ncbi:acetyltransferase family protein [Trichonephila inaurata madagascariensis]|uniref:Glucosamine 6-phosphate N-acetyltransferase n=1 Tax=Trichonephila inaurata madagascariensis TaxID=2747483 RepID=A0A8X7C6V1_9ARAC|nr:acetyltransferase family protein [Trichonephila inaurata madagascariensis]